MKNTIPDRLSAEINIIAMQQHKLLKENNAQAANEISSELERNVYTTLQQRKNRLRQLFLEYTNIETRVEEILSHQTV